MYRVRCSDCQKKMNLKVSTGFCRKCGGKLVLQSNRLPTQAVIDVFKKYAKRTQ